MKAIITDGKNTGRVIRLTESVEQDRFVESLNLDEIMEKDRKSGAYRMTEEDATWFKGMLRESGHFNHIYDEGYDDNMPDYLPDGIENDLYKLKDMTSKVFTDIEAYTVDCLRHGDDGQHILDAGMETVFLAFFQNRMEHEIDLYEVKKISDKIEGFELDD